MKNLRFICAQPAIPYYTWQVEVIINNFIEMGVNPNNMDIVCSIENGITPVEWRKLADTYNYVRFFFYNDERITKNYISSIRPNILKQHFKAHPYLKNETIFYHDCDIAFTKPINEWITNEMINDENWYGSDCRFYIGHDYIKSKGDDVLNLMCDISGISKKIIEENELNSIGAQYIMKGISHYYWDIVERECEIMFKDVTELNKQKKEKDPTHHELQIWCADMWSVLWNGWKMGYKTICHPNLEFSWGVSNVELWNSCNIFHNAGVVNSDSGFFYKEQFRNKLPYNENLNIKEETTSYEYWKLIQNTAKTSILIDHTIENKIKNDFKKYKISQLQLDPYGVCNARCWFCPVKYKGNPANGKEVMSPELIKKIIKNLIEERDKENGLVHKDFSGFYTAQYNEILLYPHFEELLKICQEYGLRFMVLSNGIPLTPEKVDLIIKYKGVVNGICLNTPAFDAETWSKRSGINIKQFDKLISNIKYAIEQLPDMVQNKEFSIQINGLNHNSFSDKGGWLDKGVEFPNDINLDVENGELMIQIKKAKELFPNMHIFSNPSLIDRAGLLDHIMTNKEAIKRNLKNGDDSKKVIGCRNGGEVGGRPIGWIHVNSAGKVFLCCNDYDMEIQFGDFKTQELKNFWGNDEHIKKIEESYNTICKNCAYAKFE